MENKNLIIGIALVGAAIYLYTKRKKEVVLPKAVVNKPINRTFDLTGCKNVQTIPCLVAPCPEYCADKVGLKNQNFSNMCGACSGANGECWD